MEMEKGHFDGSEESRIRDQMVGLFDGTFDTAWKVAMNTHGDDRYKYYAVLRDLETDLSRGFRFDQGEPLESERQTSIKELAESAMAASTLLISNFKETIQRFVADEPQQ